MSKKRGLSADEKRIRMLEIFHDSKDFFQLKDLEKIAPKQKGITMQSVKEVVQSLVDDHLINSEKIGTSIYFWSFPSEAKNAKKRKLQELKSAVDDCVKKLKKTEEAIAKESVDSEPEDERTKVLSELEMLKMEESNIRKELEKYKDSDPDYINRLKNEIGELRMAINEKTEHIFVFKSFLKNKFDMKEDVIDQTFNIPQDLDYVE